MPELPEVETMRRGVLPVVGSCLKAIDFVASPYKKIRITPRRDAFRRRAEGQRIIEIGRLGKRVLIHLRNNHSIVIEPRMTGLLLLTDPPNREHLRVGFQLTDGPVPWLWFWDRRGLGSVRLMSANQLARELGPDRLGPDALVITPDQLRERLRKSRRAIKVALLDQKAVAGVGNLYASELLHEAKVHPEKRCNQ
ncbi:MAG: DNA-formamidopyrimidine glycosylase family protein, partial [Pseudomonadales bacterium]